MENFIKFLVCMEVVVVLTTGLCHLAFYLTGKNVTFIIYPIMSGIVLFACLFSFFVIAPICNFILNL